VEGVGATGALTQATVETLTIVLDDATTARELTLES